MGEVIFEPIKVIEGLDFVIDPTVGGVPGGFKFKEVFFVGDGEESGEAELVRAARERDKVMDMGVELVLFIEFFNESDGCVAFCWGFIGVTDDEIEVDFKMIGISDGNGLFNIGGRVSTPE